jgi:TonB family protein
MSPAQLAEVFTADEVARAAGVSRRVVEARIAAGLARRIDGTRYLTSADALRLTRVLRTRVGVAAAPAPLFARQSGAAATAADDRRRVPTIASLCVHTALLGALFWATAGAPGNAATTAPVEEARMVFLITPGPGGGGGGGGMKEKKPAPRVERTGQQRMRISVPKATPDPVLTTAKKVEEPPKPTPQVVPQPKPIERPVEPLPSRVLVAPVVATAAGTRDREGVIEHPQGNADSHGSGGGGGAGTGQGTGNGQGLGSGIGDGSGGGTGGGPFRPGSGIDPPRLLREVKAEYTEEGRRRGITGDVELEIVIRRDGSVGDVTVVKGLGAGLEQRAIAAVKQWRFSPARRKGEAVDVIVEVAVEFTLR